MQPPGRKTEELALDHNNNKAHRAGPRGRSGDVNPDRGGWSGRPRYGASGMTISVS